MVNGSPYEKRLHIYGAGRSCVCKMEQEGIETDIFWIGTKAITGCTLCHGC
ncbi:MAG: hypothetical protein ACLRXQ_09755 [Phascolarctobacterium faecium]